MGNNACFLIVKAIITVRYFSLVVPLASRNRAATDMRATDTSGQMNLFDRDASGAVAPLIGAGSDLLPAGALIAVCDKVICKHTRLLHVDAEEREMGNFAPGRFGWDPVNMRELPAPIPWRGMQSLFEVPDHIITLATPAISPAQGSLL